MNQEPQDDYPKYSLVEKIRQSPPIDFTAPYDASWVKGKTIVITGGASGFGAGFARKWAANGATIIIGDINSDLATTLVGEIRASTSNDAVHYVHCNVTDWASQLNLFKEALRLSPHGGLDAVVANAGIAGPNNFDRPVHSSAEPPKPDLKIVEVDLLGVLYTAHLANFYLPRNPPGAGRDRHLLLVGSMASLGPLPGQALYCAAKHGVAGMFRVLRATAWVQGVRVNLLCPFFIDTPILPAAARALMAGGGLGKAEDVVEAATRLVADSGIKGRSIAVGPRMVVETDEKGEVQLAAVPGRDARSGQASALWEAYAHDYEDSEVFARNLIRLLNAFTRMRGWFGWVADLFLAFRFGFRRKK